MEMNDEYCRLICLVCGSEGHGQHFGVITCRACAAFFRRAVTQNSYFECRKEGNQCDYTNTLCKSCRLRKCHQLGMKMEKANELVAKQDTVQFQERFEYCVWHPLTSKPVKFIDLGPMMRRSKLVLENFFSPERPGFIAPNALQTMTFALRASRPPLSKKPEITSWMSSNEYFSNWEEQMVRTAQWLMHSEEFRRLPGHERLAFFKIVWGVSRRFERNTLGALIFGKRCYEEKLLMLSDDVAARFGTFKLDMNDISSKGFDEYRKVMRRNLLRYFDEVVKPTVEWELTETEVTFALCQIVWNCAARKLNGQTQMAAERFLEEVSNNLHAYYTEELKMRNYAARLAVIMQIVNRVLKIQRDYEKMIEMAFLFDMFQVVFSDPELFSV